MSRCQTRVGITPTAERPSLADSGDAIINTGHTGPDKAACIVRR